MESELKQYTEANREAWNEVMPLHTAAAGEKWDRAFSQPGFVCLSERELALLQQIGIAGKNVAHLCCNNGVELLSLKNLDAGECVGFDISDLAIQEARARAERCRIDCRYVCADVYEIPPSYDGRFDLVYMTAGALGWLPDLQRFFARAAALLRGGGHIFIHEIHPFAEMLPFDDAPDGAPSGASEGELLRIIEPYFKADPYVDYGGLDYVGKSEYASAKPQYWFVHTLSAILMGFVANGIALAHFSEYPIDISAGHQRLEALGAGIPLSYMLIGRTRDAP